MKNNWGEWSMVKRESNLIQSSKIYKYVFTTNHQRLDLYQSSKMFVLECYKTSKQFPADEKFGMITQIRRTALSVHLNIAEGASRKSEVERKRYFEISRGSVVEIDAAIDIAYELNYLKNASLELLGKYMVSCFKILTAMINSSTKN